MENRKFDFTAVEIRSALMLIVASLAAIICNNSPLSNFYQGLIHAHLHIPFGAGAGGFSLSVQHIVNDGLMTIFFFVVGLEVKREIIEGELSTRQQALMPVICALGGVVAPALIFLMCAGSDPTISRGWAIPTATDIAFSLGILAFFRGAVAPSLKIFLTALAIIDDLVAILIITFFYSATLNGWALIGASGTLLLLVISNLVSVKKLLIYALLGMALYLCVLYSGVHATIAGVLLAFTIPLRGEKPLLRELEHMLHPIVAYFVIPVFAFFNAGVALGAVSIHTLTSPLFIGIFLALFLGKQFGVFVSALLSARLGITSMPDNSRLSPLYGVSLLTGIGFTMSLFIGELAFAGEDGKLEVVKLAVVGASLLSALVGAIVLGMSKRS